MTFGNQCDETMSHAILDYALDAGVSFIDTADIYPANGVPELVGETENIIGRWMKGRRKDVVLATKFWACLLYTSPSPRDGLLSRMPSSA